MDWLERLLDSGHSSPNGAQLLAMGAAAFAFSLLVVLFGCDGILRSENTCHQEEDDHRTARTDN